MNQVIRKKLAVKGTVQGVGFRPFIYRIAAEGNLAGFVGNTTSGVIIEAEGTEADVREFIGKINSDGPPNAQILALEEYDIAPKGGKEFSIISSHGNGELSIMVAPDTAVCPECLREILEPSDRRFRYPFNSCVNCGPRYTIVHDIPFDRETTSMNVFPMCEACSSEYRDPRSRRFHSQTNSCRECGPHVWLTDNRGNKISCDDPIQAAAEFLKQGKIVALRGLGGFHLAVNAEDDAAVRLLRERKKRPSKPFAIMSATVEKVESYAFVTPQEKELLTSRLAPIVILKKREPNRIAESVAPGNSTLGVMVAYTPLHYLLLNGNFRALVMTSGNLSEEPIIYSIDAAMEKLADIADFFLLHNREIIRRCDDSIVKFAGGNNILMRRARGYVPRPIVLERQLKPICAYGAHLKNTICVTKNNHAYVSRYIGDLDNLESVEYLEETVAEMERLLSVHPKIIVCDMHPDYASTKLAHERVGLCLEEIQHHHAHVISCAAENGVYEKVIGVAFDGSGLGDDGAIWGSEFMAADASEYHRLAHLKYFPMPGGEAVIREPYRMAVSYLYGIMGNDIRHLPLKLIEDVGVENLSTLLNMIRRNENSPPTSGMGRLFDAVAAILGLCTTATFEGEGPILMESLLQEDIENSYEFSYENSSGCMIINPAPVLADILADMRDGMSAGGISAKFHNAVVKMVVDVCAQLRQMTGLNTVALSGGVFQNGYLVRQLTRRLPQIGFSVLTHKSLSPNDECISFGQAIIANERES
jgi:hydrogenase maturation protein HypF